MPASRLLHRQWVQQAADRIRDVERRGYKHSQLCSSAQLLRSRHHKSKRSILMDQDTPLTIKDFWTEILPRNLELDQSKLVEGWKADEGPILGFTEAPLSLDRELSDADTD